MSMQLGSRGIQSEMNVTPLIDVVLVVLIIFMVATPLVEKRFVLAVPESDVPEEQPEPDEKPEQPLVVDMHVDGSVSLNDQILPLEALIEQVHRSLRHRDPKVVFFDAADTANFGEAVDIMDAVRGAGAKHIGIIEPAKEQLGLPAPPGPVTAPVP